MSTNEQITSDKYGSPWVNNKKVHVCYVCGFPFSEEKMVKYRGKYFCKPNKCCDDIQGMRLKARTRRG